MQTEGEERPFQHIFETMSDGVILVDLETHLIVAANPAASALHGCPHEDFVGQPLTLFMHPDHYAQLDEWVTAVRAGHEVEATVHHLRRDGTSFTAETRGSGCTYQDRLCLLIVVRDVSTRIQAEQLLRQQVAAHTHEQTTLLEISQTLASALALKPGLILDQLRMIIEYTHAVLFVLEDLDLVALAVRGSQQLEDAMPLHIQLDGPATLATLLNGHRPQRIADLSSTAAEAQFLRSLMTDQATVLLAGMRSWMWVPLAVKGRVIGGMAITHTQPDAFTPHQANLALTMANQAAITLVNAQLYEQAQKVATLEERQRLAQNLHDAVNQSLFSASLIAEVLPRLWERDPDEARQSLEDLRRLTRGAMAEMRGLLVELRPLVLTDSDLGDLLRQLADALTGRTNIPVTVTIGGQDALPAEIQVTLYRLCQESLNNIAKHAGASQVTINLQIDADSVTLQIRDDGCGFDPENIPSGHYGLSMMRERTKAIGADLSITSQPGRGSEIFIHWQEVPKQELL